MFFGVGSLCGAGLSFNGFQRETRNPFGKSPHSGDPCKMLYVNTTAAPLEAVSTVTCSGWVLVGWGVGWLVGWFGLVWFGLVWFGLVWFGWVGLGWLVGGVVGWGGCWLGCWLEGWLVGWGGGLVGGGGVS